MKEWKLCPKKFEKSCQVGLCDPLLVILWKGSDSDGNMLTSHYESFMNFTVSNKTGIYHDLSNIPYDEEYTSIVTSDLEIPKDILLRLETYYEEKKKAQGKRKKKEES